VEHVVRRCGPCVFPTHVGVNRKIRLRHPRPGALWPRRIRRWPRLNGSVSAGRDCVRRGRLSMVNSARIRRLRWRWCRWHASDRMT